MTLTVNNFEQIDRLVEIISRQANIYPFSLGGPKAYLHNWIIQSRIPIGWANECSAGLSGDADADARGLVRWAINKGLNPVETGYTTLGSLLRTIIHDLGVKDSRYVFVILLKEVEQPTRSSLILDYDLPISALPLSTDKRFEYGPDFNWHGPNERIELQSFLRPPPTEIDIGILQLILDRSTGVCRIEFTQSDVRGTGFLISPDLILTNYHVIGKTDEDLSVNVHKAVFNFGKVTELGSNKPETNGTTFLPGGRTPLVKFNKSLDYAVVRVQKEIKFNPGISIIPISDELPVKGDELHLIGHPFGKSMKLSMSSEGIVYISENTGIAQYTTPSQAGASGSPCFSADWKAIILHQSERSKGFGVVRQGILMKSIFAEINTLLD